MHFFISKDSKKIFYRQWDDVKEPIAVLHIVHGMAEHISRYEDFARAMNAKGIIVYGMDARGHGKTGEVNLKLGHFEKGGWNKILEDIDILMKLQKQNYKLPFFLMGHSMGSFLVRNYINQYLPDIKGAILVGTGNADNKLTFSLTKFVANTKDLESYAYFIHKMAFKSYNDRISNRKTSFDWLSRDEKEVEKYKADPLCGFFVTNGFYSEFMGGFMQISKLEKNIKLKKNFPILFLAGKEDPVGNYGEFVAQVRDKYINQGMQNVNMILYNDMRHEIINEIDREQAYEDIYNFILGNI